jgi:hypothetical protein
MKRNLFVTCMTICALAAFPAYAGDAKCDTNDQAVFELTDVPAQAVQQRLHVSSNEAHGRQAVRAVPAVVDTAATPNLLIFPACFRNGTISVDILARQDGTSPESRAFAGIAYRIQSDGKLESVYLRALNGLKANPPSPRDKRAVQYYAHPDWTFDRLRATYPDGRYESGANIGPDEWVNLTVTIDEKKVVVLVNNEEVLKVDAALVEPSAGKIGLWVGPGTEAHFSKLRIAPNNPAQ